MRVEKESIGVAPEGIAVDQYTLSNAAGMRVSTITYGATLTSVCVSDRNGKIENITLSLDTLQDYVNNSRYLGSTVGRFANRIARGTFSLDGVEYFLATNNGPNHLHGGIRGFNKVVWAAEPFKNDNSAGVKFSYTSPNGEEGYPGTLSTQVTYSLTEEGDLRIEYVATTDKPTVVNLTNHTYWNLTGNCVGNILDHELIINADRFLPVDDNLIPLGTLKSVAGTPLDFTKPRSIGAMIDQVNGGYDHCYAVRRQGNELSLAARVIEPKSGRAMEVYTTQPGVQLYTSGFLAGTRSSDGQTAEKHGAFCLETQHYPDTPNQPAFPSSVLRPGETYEHSTVHKFGISPRSP